LSKRTPKPYAGSCSGASDAKQKGVEMPNWAEIVTAVATAVGAIGLLGGIGAAIFASRQVVEARLGRQAEIAADFFRRWSDTEMVESRRLVATYATPEAIRDAFAQHMASNDTEAYVMLRELDYFEQLGALEEHGGFSFEMIKTLLGRRLIERFEMWRPTIDFLGGSTAYPLFERLAAKMTLALDQPAR
jgi:hypothetical protein